MNKELTERTHSSMQVKARANERDMLAQHYPTLLGQCWLMLVLGCSNDHNRLGNVDFTVIPREIWVWYLPKTLCETAMLSRSSAIMYGDRWIQKMENAKMHRYCYCYCSLPFWKYSRSHKQEQRDFKLLKATRTGTSTTTLQNNRLNYRIQSLRVWMEPPGSSVTGEQNKCWHILGKEFDWFQTGGIICQHHAT